MYFYFQSNVDAALKINGGFAGRLCEPLKISIDASRPPFLEFCPLNCAAPPTAFFPDENFTDNPPEGVIVTDLRGGYFVAFDNVAVRGEYGVIEQKKFSDAVITVFCDNGYKLSIETPADFYTEGLPFAATSAEISREFIDGNDVIVVFFPTERYLCAYSAGKVKKLFSRVADGYDVKNGFCTVERKKDVAKHEIKIRWDCSAEFKEISREVSHAADFRKEAVCPKILPYAFAEEFAAGGDYTFYLAENVKKNADKLAEFFGEFIGVCVPPSFRDYREVGLIKKIRERKYAVDYYVFETENDKITNVKKVD